MVSLQFPTSSSPSWPPQRLVININWVMIGHVPLQQLSISYSRITYAISFMPFISLIRVSSTMKLFFAFSDIHIHDLRTLQLAVHRMWIGLSDLVRQFCFFSWIVLITVDGSAKNNQPPVSDFVFFLQPPQRLVININQRWSVAHQHLALHNIRYLSASYFFLRHH